MAYTNNNGQVRVGVRGAIVNSPVQQTNTVSASLLQALYGVWNGDTNTTELDKSLFGVWNGESSNNVSVKNAWNANGNAIDSKSAANGTVAIPSGTTFTTGTMTYSTGKLGSGSFTFDGTNFINLPNNTLNFTGDFTVSCWFYTPANYVANGSLVSAFDNKSSYTTYYGWNFGYDSTNKCIGFSIGNPSGGSYANVALSTPNNSIVAGQWNHVAITRKFNTRSRIYINGVLSTSNTSTLNPTYNYGLSYIGAIFYGFQQPHYNKPNAGLKIDSIYTFESELDATAVSELYNSGNGQEYPFTISNALIASPKDVVGTNHGTLMGGCTYTTGKVGNAFSFDGVNDYVSLPNNSLNSTIGTDFSVSLWVNFTSTANQTLISNMTSPSINVWSGWEIRLVGGRPTIFMWNNAGDPVGAQGAVVSTNTWYHIVATRKKGSRTRIYINGSLEQTDSINTNDPWINGTYYPNIGHLQYTSTFHALYMANGSKIDALNVWNKELTSDEVVQLYNSGTGAQYPFTGTFSSAGNQFGVDNGTLMSGCTFGDGKIGKAFQFDGINDYVSLPTNSLSLGVDFSISLWVNLTSLSTRQCFVGSYNFNPSTGGMYGFRVFYAPSGNTSNTGGVRFDYGDGLSSGDGYYGSSSRALLTNNYLTTNTWYHIVVTKKSSSAQIYINGSLAASNTDYVQPTYSGNTYPTIGVAQYLQNQFDWYMSSGSKIDGINIYQKELTQSEVTELYNSGNGIQITKTPIVQTGLVLNLDASRKSSYVGSGTTWNDISGNGYSGTLTNGPSFAQLSSNTDISGLFIFDGVNDYVTNIGDLSTFSFIQNTGVYTISAWVKPNSLNTEMYYLGNNDGTSAKKGFFLGNSGSSNSLILSISRGTIGTSTLNHIINNFYTSTDWVNIVCVGNGVNNKVYKNGVLFSTSSNFSTFSTGNTDNTLSVGRINSANLWYWNGFVSSVNIYNKSLSDSEVLQNYNATKSRFGY